MVAGCQITFINLLNLPNTTEPIHVFNERKFYPQSPKAAVARLGGLLLDDLLSPFYFKG